MTAPNPDDRLQQYFDGALAADEAEALRRELEKDSELRAKLDGLEHLSGLIRQGAETRAAEVDSDALFAAIEAKLDADDSAEDDDPMFPVSAESLEATTEESEGHEPRPKLAVVAGGKRDEGPERGAGKPRTGVWLGVAATTLAAAAALLFWLTQPGGEVQDEVDGPDDGPVVAEPTPPPGSEVEEVDFGYSTGAIFSVEGEEGEQYAVVWISDEKVALDEEGEERIQ